MKKILFFLLFTVSIYGQTYQNPTFGIVTEKNNATDSAPAYFTTTQVDGVHKKTPAALVAKVAIVNDSLATKENVANKSDSYTASSSTTYASTKALVDGLGMKANDANVVHKTGEETIGLGEKYFTDNVNFTSIAVSGQATGGAAVYPNEFVIKSQLDGKADLDSPSLTGTPTAPTATAGTNTTQIATTAFVQAVDANVVHKTGNETILGLKTFQSFGGVPNIKLTNNETGDRDNYIEYQNASGIWQLGMKGYSSTLFQLKYGDTPYFSVDRFTANTSIGYNAPASVNTLFLQDLSPSGSTKLVLKEGTFQNDDYFQVKSSAGSNTLRIDKNGSLQRKRNLNRLFVFSGDSWSNDVVDGYEAGDWPSYLLSRGYMSGEADYVVTAVGGRQVSTMLANYATEIHPHEKTKYEQERVLFLLGGINDIFGNRTAVDIYNDLKAMWSNAKNDGFSVVAFTVAPALGLSGAQETERLALNNLINSDRTIYDFLIRPEILFPDPSNTLFWNVDGVHLNSNGAQYLGYRVYDYIYSNKYFFNAEASEPLVSGNGTNLVTDSNIIAKSYTGSAILTGTPTAPTATVGTNTTQIATTAFVLANSSSGTYTPTLTNTTNITSSTLNAAYYVRNGNLITVTIAVQLTLTATADTVFTFSLPVSGATVVNGVGQGNLTSGGGSVNAYGIVDTTNSTTAQLRIGSAAVAGSGAGVANIIFTYSL